MKLSDFEYGKKYRKVGGTGSIGTVYECSSRINNNIVLKNPDDHYDGYNVFCEEIAECFEPEIWMPKRGEEVLVDDLSFPRIFLTYIEGAYKPYICVEGSDSDAYKIGDTFGTCSWKSIKQFKEDVITLTVNGQDVKLSEKTIKAIKEAL